MDDAVLHIPGAFSIGWSPLRSYLMDSGSWPSRSSAPAARVLTAGELSSNADAPPVSMTFTSWATDDGGARWLRGGILSVVQDPGSSWQGFLDFVNPEDGWFSANEDDIDTSLGTTLLRTVDGGAHWGEVAHLTQSSISPGAVPCYAQPTATFCLISPTTGWLTGGGWACPGLTDLFLGRAHSGPRR